MTRTWTQVGRKVVGCELENFDYMPGEVPEDRIISKKTVEQAIEALKWRELPCDGSLEVPMMPGEGIKAAIRELKIPKVSHIAWSNELAPYGFYGIRGHYKNGDAEVYIVDLGTHLTPVCSDFHGEAA